MKSRYLLLVSLCMVLASCSKSSDGDSESTSATKEVAPASTEEPAKEAGKEASQNPCELLTEAVVRKHLELADDVKIENSLSEPGGHPHCSYNWSTLTPEEEKVRNAELAERAMARARNKGKAQSIVDMAMSQNSGRGSAHLTQTKEMKSEASAIGALAAARSYMEKRAKAKAGDESVDLTTLFVDIEGVGAKAHYSAKQKQISFVHGKRLFHLGVKPHDERDPQELAKTIAIDILK